MEKDTQMKLRLTPELKQLIDEAADANKRSLNSEILARLEQSFAKTPDLSKLSWLELISLLDRLSEERGTPISISVGKVKK